MSMFADIDKLRAEKAAKKLAAKGGPPPKPKDRDPKVWGYGRISVVKVPKGMGEEQKKHLRIESIETQKTAMKDYAKYQQLPGDVTFFIDAAVSGKIPWEERPAGSQMFKHLKPGDHVVIAKLDRAFRRLSDCVTILDRFEKMSIKVHIVNLMGGAIDLGSPMGKFMIHILAAFAELERAFISERTKDGMAHRKKNNFQYAHHAGYGFKWTGKKVHVEGQWRRMKERDDEERNVMRSIVQWRMQDSPLTWPEIAEHLGKLGIICKEGRPWSETRVRRAALAELKLQIAEGRGNR